MAYKEFYDDILKKDFEKLYILYGEERYLINSMLNHLKKILNNEFIEFNYINFDTYDFYTIINAIRTLPFMDNKKIILVNNDDFLDKNSWSEKEQKVFIDEISKSNDIIFIILSVNVDKRKSFYKKLGKLAKIVEFGKIDKKEFKIWCRKKIEDNNSSVNNIALDLYVERSDYFNKNLNINLYNIENDLLNLCLKYSKIDEVVINSEYSENMKASIFTLCDLIFEKKLEQAIMQYNLLVNEKEEPIKIFFMIHRHLRMMIDVYSLIEKNININEISRILKLEFFIVKKIISQLNNNCFNKKILLSNLNDCVLVDYSLKQGGKNPDDMLIFLISKLSSC